MHLHDIVPLMYDLHAGIITSEVSASLTFYSLGIRVTLDWQVRVLFKGGSKLPEKLHTK